MFDINDFLSDDDVIDFMIYCENESIYRDCLRKLFSMEYVWWSGHDKDVYRVSYEPYIVCYTGDPKIYLPKNICVSDSKEVNEIKIINGNRWLRHSKLLKIKDSCK